MGQLPKIPLLMDAYSKTPLTNRVPFSKIPNNPQANFLCRIYPYASSSTNCHYGWELGHPTMAIDELAVEVLGELGHWRCRGPSSGGTATARRAPSWVVTAMARAWAPPPRLAAR